MGGAFSVNTADSKSKQNSSSSETQTYAGTCDVTCSNSINGLNIDIINSDVEGGIQLNQLCSANSTCLFDNTLGATSDIIFKAANSSGAQAAIGAFNVDTSVVKSYQTINQVVNQAINQSCNTVSTNQLSNVNILAENSNLGGAIVVNQDSSASGNCSLNGSINAATLAQGSVDNCADAGGKGKQCAAGKGGSSWLTYVLYAVGIFIAITVISVLVRIIRKPSTNLKTSQKVAILGREKPSPTPSGGETLSTTDLAKLAAVA